MDGLVTIGFNQELYIPDFSLLFQDKRKLAVVANTRSQGFIDLRQINVPLYIADFQFQIQSSENPRNLTYSMQLREWTNLYL